MMMMMTFLMKTFPLPVPECIYYYLVLLLSSITIILYYYYLVLLLSSITIIYYYYYLVLLLSSITII
jgi:hypothetical protein